MKLLAEVEHMYALASTVPFRPFDDSDCVVSATKLLEIPTGNKAQKYLITARGLLNRSETPHSLAAQPQGGLTLGQKQRLRLYIEQHLDRAITLSELAQLLDLSYRHFCRVLGQSLGQSAFAFALTPQVPSIGGGGLPRCRLKRVVDYIDENQAGDLTLTQLAAVAGMSPHYFAELFRQSTGRTPHQYVLLRRIELAKQRLRDPRCSVIEAGLDAGFQNPSHFARVFRKWVGLSPSGFRSRSHGTVPTKPLPSRHAPRSAAAA